MPGIVGIAGCDLSTRNGWPVIPVELLRNAPGQIAESCVVAVGECLFGRATLPAFAKTRAIQSDPALTAMVDGEFLNRRELTDAWCPNTAIPRSDAELLIAGYRKHGDDVFARLDGKFAAALWDHAKRQLVLVSDRFGLKPLYIHQGTTAFSFASQLRPLLATAGIEPKADVTGVSLFLSFGQLLGDRTMVDGVRVVPAATFLKYDVESRQLQTRRYWRPEPASPIDPASALERVDTAFATAVEKCVGTASNLGISLSGGLDGRTILAAIDTSLPPIQSLCLGMQGSLDHRSAARIAEVCGCRHHSTLLDDGFLGEFSRHFRRMIDLTDGQYLDQCIVIPTLERYRELGIDVLLRGHAGELMHLDKAYNFSVDGEFAALTVDAGLRDWCCRRLSAYMIEGLDRPLLCEASLEEMREFGSAAVADAFHQSAYLDDKFNRLTHLFLGQRTRRETAMSMTIFGSVAETRLPYLDADVVAATMALPGAMRIGDQVQSHIIRKRRPELLRIANSNTGAPMGAPRWFRRAATLRMKILGRLGVKGYQPYERLGLWLRAHLRPLVEEVLLRNECLQGGVLLADTVRWITSEHFAGRRNFTYLILGLMVLQQGRRHLSEPFGNVESTDSHDGVTNCATS